MAKPKPQVSIRRPPFPESDRTSVEQFISSGESPTLVLNHPEEAAKKASKVDPTQGRGIIHRRSGRALRRMTVYLEPNLARSFAIYCAGRGQSISDTLAEAVSMFLDAKDES